MSSAIDIASLRSSMLLVSLLCAAACGSSSNEALDGGTSAFEPVSEKYTAVDTTIDGGPDLSAPIILQLANFSLTCAAEASPPATGTLVRVQMQMDASNPQGSFNVDPSCSGAGACVYGVVNGQPLIPLGGTINVSYLGSDAMGGSYELHLASPAEDLSGLFTAPYCP